MEVANISEQIMYASTTVGLNLCTATITKSKNRLKSYKDPNSTKDQYFLNDGEEFEIELFNPKKSPVLAKISINGKRISERGIILYPGQRIFLERFIETPEKLKFSTYKVEDSPESKQAISDNGNVKVEFYDEYAYSYNPISTTIWGGNTGSYFTYPNYQLNGTGGYNNGTFTFNGSSTLTGTNITGSGTTNTFFSNSGSLSNFSGSTYTANNAGTTFNTSDSHNGSTVCTDSLETGRIAAGDNSSQSFINSSGNFNSWYSNIVDCKILPISAKPVEISELRNYCPNCRTRIKKASWKYCPSCGNEV